VAAAAEGVTDARTLWRRLGRAGIPDLLGGGPHDCGPETPPDRLGDLLTELDARLPLGCTLSVCVQVATVLPLLRTLAEDSPAAGKVLVRATRGDAVVALAITDAGVSGSDLLDMRTAITSDGGTARLDGAKEWITNAGQCDHLLVLARHRPQRHITSFRWVLLNADRPGVSCRPSTGELFPGAGLGDPRFTGVALDPDDLVGRPGRALAEAARQLAVERLAGALWARALCRRVLADTHRYLVTRPAGGGPLWTNAAVRDRFARCVVEWRRMDALCAAATGWPATAEAMVLKAACAESADRILGECVQLSGAAAFRDGGVARTRAEAAMFGIAGGATGTMLAGIAEDATGLLGSAR
jgi:acyl-CoA dehydrogenase